MAETPLADDVPRPTTTDTALRVLRDAIVDGHLAQGSQLRELHVATTLGLGRSAVREALRQLVQEGLVEHQPNRGAFVRVMDVAAALDVYAAREAIEVGVAQRLLTDEVVPDLRHLESAYEKLRDAATGDGQPSDRLIRADVDFHRQLVRLAGSPRLSRAYETLAAESMMVLRHHPPYPGWDYASAHRDILDAVRALDADAPAIVCRHLRLSASLIGDRLPGAVGPHLTRREP